MTVAALPESLAEIRDEFLELPESDRLQLLLEFSRELPPVPAKYDGHPELCERVAECQSPVYIVMDVDDDGIVSMHAMAPAEAPTTRGFASILVQGLTGLTVGRGPRRPRGLPAEHRPDARRLAAAHRRDDGHADAGEAAGAGEAGRLMASRPPAGGPRRRRAR